MSVLGKNPNVEEKENNGGGESTKNVAPKIKDIEKWTNKNQKAERKGRMSLSDKYAKKPRMMVYATDEEYEALKKVAQEHGLPVSTYIILKLVYGK